MPETETAPAPPPPRPAHLCGLPLCKEAQCVAIRSRAAGPHPESAAPSLVRLARLEHDRSLRALVTASRAVVAALRRPRGDDDYWPTVLAAEQVLCAASDTEHVARVVLTSMGG